MMLEDLIERLKVEPDQDRVPRLGFDHPHSYRGYYERLAFTPREDVTIGSMLAAAEGALGRTYHGYKGGDFIMDRYSECYLANYGECGDELSMRLLEYMLEAAR